MNKERVALVTGASAGIGAAITKRLARQGLRVFGTSRNPQLAQTMKGVEMLPLDVRSDESVEASVETVMARTGRLDILINNVGFILIGAAEEVSIAEAKEEFETNFFGTMRLVRTVLPIMRKQGDGRIINMSGPAGIVSVPFMRLFSASKAALEGYSLALRQEVKQFGIYVSLILPGPIQTQVVEYSKSSAQRLPAYEGQEQRFLNGWKKGYKNAD